MKLAKAVWALIRREPVRTVTLLTAALTGAAAFGLHLTDGQSAAILTLAGLLVGGGEAARSQVTPTVKLPDPPPAEKVHP